MTEKIEGFYLDGTKYEFDGGGAEYSAGEGIEIGTVKDYSAMWGPCPLGFHIPTKDERQAVIDIWTALGGGATDGNAFGIALKLPYAGSRMRSNGATGGDQGTIGWYHTCNGDANNGIYSYYLIFRSYEIKVQSTGSAKAEGKSIRPFKDIPVKPDSSWTKLYGTSIEAGGIFYNSDLQIISLSSDGQNWITISDKNVGASNPWNGDTLAYHNCGFYFQWGNVYPFPRSGTVTTTSTLANASTNGPGNYFSGDKFITTPFASGKGNWSTTNNINLRGGVTGVKTINDAITNTNNKIIVEINSKNPTGGQILNLHHAVMKYGAENVYVSVHNVFDDGNDDPFFLTLRYEGYYGSDWYDLGGPAIYCFSTTMSDRGLHYIALQYGTFYDGPNMMNYEDLAFGGTWEHNKITTATA